MAPHRTHTHLAGTADITDIDQDTAAAQADRSILANAKLAEQYGMAQPTARTSQADSGGSDHGCVYKINLNDATVLENLVRAAPPSQVDLQKTLRTQGIA